MTRLGAALVERRRRLKPLPPIRPGDGFYALWLRIAYLGDGVRKENCMKFASLENALMAATLVILTVFVLWSVKIIVASA
jgi:hypothetical protein